MVQSTWPIDPDDPRAPPVEVWERLGPEERERVVASLPAEVPLELHPPEGDPHRVPKEGARDALDEFFRRTGRRIYVSSELATYYPNEPRFCPDILAVLDTDPRERSRWVVSHEGRGLDFVMEVHVSGDHDKDFRRNVERYARLGIPEYFIFDRPEARLVGYRLREGGGAYERLVPQAGRFTSEILGLELAVDGGMVRFYYGTAPLPFVDELIGKLGSMVDELTASRDAAARRADQEAARADQEAARADQEAARADQEAARAAALEAELEALKRRS
ncbi:MAG: Uma2 family endonuclease [Polyangiaceae bacterium]|nr:Uma2 family endonuclease [Polyangiaceae bacterium]